VAVAWIVTALDRFLIHRGFDDPPTQIMLLALLPRCQPVWLVRHSDDCQRWRNSKKRNRYFASG
jgi:hypothetical protein